MESQHREVTFPIMPKKEVELKSKPQRSRIQLCALCTNLRAGNQAFLSYPHGWRGIHRLFVLNYFHYRNQQRMLREKSASRERSRMSCFSCRAIMRPNQYFGNTLPFLSITSHSKSPWERRAYSAFLQGTSIPTSNKITRKFRFRVALVYVWQPSLLYLDSTREMTNLIRQLSNHSESNWILRNYSRDRGSAVETLSLTSLWKRHPQDHSVFSWQHRE